MCPLASRTIKLWDLRQSQAPSQAATEVSTDPFHSSSTSPSNSPAPNSSTSSSRPRGIASLALTPCGSTVYALSSSSHIQSYSALTLSLPESSGPFPEPMGDPRLRVNSFYLRLAVSPCGSWLASGSSSGDVLVWDIARSMRSRGGPVVLSAGAEEGETSSVDWGADGMVSELFPSTPLPSPMLSPCLFFENSLQHARTTGPYARGDPIL